MVDGDPLARAVQLEEMEQSEIETFVPGHGPIGRKSELAKLRGYITFLDQSVARAVREGGTIEN